MCHEPVTDISKLPKEIQEKVYKPSAEESYNIETKFDQESAQPVAIHPGDGKPDAEVDIEI